MTSQRSSLTDVKNTIDEKSFLEFTVHLLEFGFFNPVVFCHDNFWFDKKKYSQTMIGFINVLSFLYSCGIIIETKIMEPVEIESDLYSKIMLDTDHTEVIKCYELIEVDFSDMNVDAAQIPDNCKEENFILVKLYLIFRTGAALNKKAIENIFNKKLSDSEMLFIRKQLAIITGRKIIKLKDNSYEMR
jgi:hypothetical protein